MPGKGDYISIKEDGLTVEVQNRLILSNLKEVYMQYFKKEYPEEKVCFSEFAELCSPLYILVGSSTTHSVYVRGDSQ